jgi:hypothetical protein
MGGGASSEHIEPVSNSVLFAARKPSATPPGAVQENRRGLDGRLRGSAGFIAD